MDYRIQARGYYFLTLLFAFFGVIFLFYGLKQELWATSAFGGIVLASSFCIPSCFARCPYCKKTADMRLKFCGQCGGDLSNVPDDLVE